MSPEEEGKRRTLIVRVDLTDHRDYSTSDLAEWLGWALLAEDAEAAGVDASSMAVDPSALDVHHVSVTTVVDS